MNKPTIDPSIKSQLNCDKPDQTGKFGGKSMTKGWYHSKYKRRGNHSYAMLQELMSQPKHIWN